MAQKFISLEEAADQLGISKDLLNQLREANKVRATATAPAGNFAAKTSNKLAAEGIPRLDPGASDLVDLDDDDDLERIVRHSADVRASRTRSSDTMT